MSAITDVRGETSCKRLQKLIYILGNGTGDAVYCCDYWSAWGVLDTLVYFGDVVKIWSRKIWSVEEGILMF